MSARSTALDVLSTGPLATVQDLGRPGAAAYGVGVSGAADRASLRLGNRLVGNPEGAAAIEVTAGGLAVRATGLVQIALTGAPCPAALDGVPIGMNAPVWVRAGAELRMHVPTAGLRTYLAVRGGIDVPQVVGARATDVLAELGPATLAPGTRLPVGPAPDVAPLVDVAPVAPPHDGEITLRVLRGPRDDWFTATAMDTLTGAPYVVTADSNRVGMRLEGPRLERARTGELPSEGMVGGAVQVPASGQPTVFLADHPLTGGYPVLAVVLTDDIGVAAQARPGQRLWFREVR